MSLGRWLPSPVFQYRGSSLARSLCALPHCILYCTVIFTFSSVVFPPLSLQAENSNSKPSATNVDFSILKVQQSFHQTVFSQESLGSPGAYGLRGAAPAFRVNKFTRSHNFGERAAENSRKKAHSPAKEKPIHRPSRSQLGGGRGLLERTIKSRIPHPRRLPLLSFVLWRQVCQDSCVDPWPRAGQRKQRWSSLLSGRLCIVVTGCELRVQVVGLQTCAAMLQ